MPTEFAGISRPRECHSLRPFPQPREISPSQFQFLRIASNEALAVNNTQRARLFRQHNAKARKVFGICRPKTGYCKISE